MWPLYFRRGRPGHADVLASGDSQRSGYLRRSPYAAKTPGAEFKANRKRNDARRIRVPQQVTELPKPDRVKSAARGGRVVAKAPEA